MNQLELILENIRLSHTERLMQEAQTDLELIRGQRLINESVMALGRELSYLLQEDAIMDGLTNRAGAVNEAARTQALQDQYRAERGFTSRLPYGAQEYLNDPVGNTKAALGGVAQAVPGYAARNARTLIPAGVGAAIGAGLGYEDGDMGMDAGMGAVAGAGAGMVAQAAPAALRAGKTMSAYTMPGLRAAGSTMADGMRQAGNAVAQPVRTAGKVFGNGMGTAASNLRFR